MVYITANKEFVEKTSEKANKDAISEFHGEDEPGKSLLWDLEDQYSEIEITEDGRIKVVSDSKFGFISVDVALTSEDLVKIVELVVKRLNKFKNVIEGLK